MPLKSDRAEAQEFQESANALVREVKNRVHALFSNVIQHPPDQGDSVRSILGMNLQRFAFASRKSFATKLHILSGLHPRGLHDWPVMACFR